MRIQDLAKQYCALESIDKTEFRKRARLLQSIWREEQGFPIGQHVSKKDSRPLGSRLEMPWASETLANYLSSGIKDVVKAEVLDPTRSKGKLYGKPRIFNDLLSSQPLAFNLFAELQRDTALCSRLVESLTRGRFSEAEAVEFEYSPGRSDPAYTGDRSAFDVYIECRDSQGAPAFLGIEVKYHEDLKNPAADSSDRHGEIADRMNCFSPEARALLQKKPLQQIWRDHLLAGAMLQHGDFPSGAFVFLYPSKNEDCHAAITDYRACLTDGETLEVWTLEDVIRNLKALGDHEWVRLFEDRYLGFDRIDELLRG